MTERPSLGIGLMSGTSLDGMDAALVRFTGPTRAELLGFEQLPYPSDYRERVSQGIRSGGSRDLALLHAEIGDWAARAVHRVLETARCKASSLDFIAFHGQTVWHEPPRVTWQLGEPAILAEAFGVKIVSNFRSRDLAAGGQGAPLVPIADVLLFGADHPRALLNLGGMANVTYVPNRLAEHGVIAFDTGPGMALIDELARRIDPSLPFDVDGKVAARGTPDEAILERLLADPFFSAPPPKSTGREKFGVQFADFLEELVPGPDGVATSVELTARSVAAGVRLFGSSEVVASGGGCHHPGLMASLGRHLGPDFPIVKFDSLFFSGDAKEAVAFALLGYLTIHGQPGNVPSATGARGPRVLGQVTLV